MQGTPTLRGWRPTRRRHVIRQQCSHTPTMIRDPGGHSRCPVPTPPAGPRGSAAQTRMRRAVSTTRRRSSRLTTWALHKAPYGRTRRGDRLGPSPQPPIKSNCLNLNQKKCKFLYDQDMAPWTQPGSSTRARVYRIAQGLPHGPDGRHQAIGTDQQGTMGRPPRYRPLVRAQRHGGRLAWTPVGQQRHHQAHRLCKVRRR